MQDDQPKTKLELLRQQFDSAQQQERILAGIGSRLHQMKKIAEYVIGPIVIPLDYF